GGGGGGGGGGGRGEEPAMAGDVNLFFNDYDDPGMCEVEVMVAEPRWRRKGLAREAVLMLMRYALDNLGATTFYCKIGDANLASRALFEKLGFSEHAYVEAFKETELRFRAEPGGATAAALRAETEHVETVPCIPSAAAAAAAAAEEEEEEEEEEVVEGGGREEGGATEEQ
ncbi:unnamed protein product, partial [Laminaria digitata]